MPDLTVTVPVDITRVVLDIQRAAAGPVESADLTTVPPATQIRDAAGLIYTITPSGQAAIGGQPVSNTHGVQQLKYCKHPTNPSSLPPGVYQFTGSDWWGPVTAATGGDHVPGDPSGAAPPITTGVPPQAAAVGYNQLTFGGEGIIINGNWFKVGGNDNVTQQGQGVVCAGGSNGYNAHLKSKSAFGQGFYAEAELFWTGVYNGWGQPGSTGWPSWWMNCIESESGQTQYSAELDCMEYWGDTKWGGAIHSWYGGQGQKLTIGHENPITNFDHSKPHKYGVLWVPATSAAKGYCFWYFDGLKQNGMDIVWDKYTGQLPPVDSSVLDNGHQCLILGSGAGNPMTVTYAKVWQRNAANNITVR